MGFFVCLSNSPNQRQKTRMRAGRENIDVNADKGLKGSSIKKNNKILSYKAFGYYYYKTIIQSPNQCCLKFRIKLTSS